MSNDEVLIANSLVILKQAPLRAQLSALRFITHHFAFITSSMPSDLDSFVGHALREFDEHATRVVEAAGDVIGPYTLIEELGVGGFGSVWRAQQSQPVKR